MEIIAYSFIYGSIFLLTIMFIILTVRYFKLKFNKEPMKLLDSTISLEPGFIKSYSSNDIPLPDIKNGDSPGVTFAFKLFLENAMENEKWGRRYDQLKPIINYYPGVRYHPYDNYLEFGVELRDNIQMNSYQTVKYQDPPLQKWLNLVVIYSSNKIVVYLDDEIVVSKKIKNPPIIKPRPLHIGEENNNIKGFLGPIYYWPYPLDILEIPKATQLIKYK